MHEVDLNCDTGESFGAYRLGDDAELLRLVTSANVACGFHAGDPATMRRTVETAIEHGVQIGAHPGLDDLIGFGRRRIAITPEEAYELVLYQTGALDAFVRAAGGRLRHVKPHGALYNMAAENHLLAVGIARAVRDYDPNLILFGLAGSESITAARELGLRVAEEVFADRTYQSDGSLTPRQHPHALITDPRTAFARVLRMITEGIVTPIDGADFPITADTVCIHGDTPGAVAFARSLRGMLEEAGITLRAVGDV